MPYVDEITPIAATPPLRETYQNLEKMFGFVPHYFQALGAKPEVIKAQLALNQAIMGDGALSTGVKEQIGIAVSGLNSSSYCIAIHMEILRSLGVEKNLGRKLAVDYENAEVDEKTKALLRFAEKLTKNGVDIEDSDVARLREAGWDDAAIREAVLAIAYFNFVNRVSFGLGLLPEF